MDAECWLVPLADAAPGAATLLCLPYAGAGAQAYRPLAAALTGVRILSVELPGRGRLIQEPLIASIGPLADAVADMLTGAREAGKAAGEAVGAGPGTGAASAVEGLVLYGHSMGALLAFEVAHRLAGRSGPAVAHLVVSGCAPPQARRPAARPRHELSDDDLVAELVALGADPEPWSEPEIRALMLPTVRADLAAAELYAYTSRPPLRCPVTAVAGVHDPEALPGVTAGWSAESGGGFVLHTLPAGHYLLDTHLADVAAIVGGLMPRP
ncbi:alpha/beta fold hydrolase [Streptomycetaceae bacterium NBC_01309]